MNRSTAIAALGIAGWAISYAFFLKWLSAHGWDFFGGWAEAFTASDFSTGLIMDLVVVTMMIVAVAVWERRRIGTRWAVAMVAALGLSVSVSLAIYLVRLWQVRGEEGAGA